MFRDIDFFVQNVPTLSEFGLWGPLSLLWAYGCLFVAGSLKRHRGLKTGYSRKIFHFCIFTSSAIIHAIWGLRIVYVFGAATSVVIFYAILRGKGHLLYEAMAREKDAPHQTYYILAPYCATLLGGITSNLFFGDAALAGYLVAGFGDAIGEPVGTRFGKHPYRVPAFRGVPCIRTFEGSAAVFFMSGVAIVAAFALSPQLHFQQKSIFLIPGLALFFMLLEAISPHGWDNAVLQIVPSCCVALFF